MLVLSRKESESLILMLPDGREVKIAVVRIMGHKVRIGIDAPREMAVHRREIHATTKGATNE